jgi:predicted restriction endonuclease
LEKAAADCGFEMTAVPHPGGLELRSARFPETVFVRVTGERSFEVTASDPAVLDQTADRGPLKVEGYGELYALLRKTAARARTKPNRVADEFKKKTAAMPKTTEAERLVVQRVGQDLFRNALLDYWQGKCCITGLDVPELLRASHIRPWAQCETDEQRLDVFNGLLLAPHLDALFDAGLMTVDADGTVRVAGALTPQQRQRLGLPITMTVQSLRSEHQSYLQFHRAFVWRG